MGKTRLRDFDPEELLNPAPSDSDENSSDEESVEDTQAGREHYADVGKSKLRKKEAVPLGPQYEGSRISRDDALDEDSDDPFARGGFEEGDSDEESDGPEVNGNGVDHGDLEEEEGSVVDEDGNHEDMDGFSDEDEDMDEDEAMEDSDENDQEEQDDVMDRAQLRKIMNEEQRSVAATISLAAKADAEKGEAVKSQRKTFDSLLNTRIRLQKAIISTNSMAHEPKQGDDAEDALQAAEKAALHLLSTLTSLRSTLDTARSGEKRKRSAPLTQSTSMKDIWASLQASESSSKPHRNAVLEKWSQKTKATPIRPSSRRLNNTAQQTLTDVLNSHLSDTTRLVKRTRVPRSCAPVQAAASIPKTPDIYDDADFYGLLLKELLEQRSQDVVAANGGGSEFTVKAPWQAARDAKTKKVVDTRASKGRKLRYTVHEKLQNFMAPEDRGVWGERQIDELFGSLFGQRMGFGEEMEDGEESEDENMEEQGLRLFRN